MNSQPAKFHRHLDAENCFSENLGYNPIRKGHEYTRDEMKDFGICSIVERGSFVCSNTATKGFAFCMKHYKKITEKRQASEQKKNKPQKPLSKKSQSKVRSAEVGGKSLDQRSGPKKKQKNTEQKESFVVELRPQEKKPLKPKDPIRFRTFRHADCLFGRPEMEVSTKEINKMGICAFVEDEMFVCSQENYDGMLFCPYHFRIFKELKQQKKIKASNPRH